MNTVSKNIETFEVISRIVKYILIFTFLLFLLSVISTVVEYSGYELSFSISAIIYFIELYDTPIKIGAALFAILTIWLTLERMKQTKVQLEEIADNNRFNNFFRHREEFVKDFKDNEFFIEINELTDKDIAKDLKTIYNIFYYESPNDFESKINKTAKEKIDAFIKAVEISELNRENYPLNLVPNIQLAKLSSLNFSELKSHFTAVHTKLIPAMREVSNRYQTISKSNISKFIFLNELYWSGVFYQALLHFDGSPVFLFENFSANFIDFRDSLHYEEARTLVKENNSVV